MAYFVVIILALAGVAMLRVDMPGHPRPIRLKSFWIVVALFLAAANAVLLVIGSISFNLTGYGGLKEFFIGLGAIAMGFVLYVWRVYVQDRGKIVWRDGGEYVAPPALGVLAEAPEPVAQSGG
jgi:amino acid transporter